MLIPAVNILLTSIPCKQQTVVVLGLGFVNCRLNILVLSRISGAVLISQLASGRLVYLV